MAVPGSDEAVKKIFSRCLLSCPHLELWRCYLDFIRKFQEEKTGGREDVRRAFEFALLHVGLDIGAGPLWEDFIRFLKTTPASGPHEESQRMASIRKAYQRAIAVPMAGGEQLWKDYEAFENSLSRALAKGLLLEHQPKYIAARAMFREKKKLMDKVDKDALAEPPENAAKDDIMVAWAQLLSLERRNPLALSEGDLAKSVAFAYDQCLMPMSQHANIWYDYAMWHVASGRADAAVLVFQKALGALPGSVLLHFAYAEVEENRNHMQEAKAVYESLLQQGGMSALDKSLAHVQMMRFVQRVEGAAASRKAFMAARKNAASSYHVYVVSALLEWCVNKEPKVARNVLELGLKKHIHTPAYVLEYADFLGKMNDETNMRALFERALSVLPPEESQEVWSSLLECEQLYGDLASQLKLEKRRREALQFLRDDGQEDSPANFTPEEGTDAGDTPTLDEVARRYTFQNLVPCPAAELGYGDCRVCFVKRMRNLNKRQHNQGEEGGSGRPELLSEPSGKGKMVPALQDPQEQLSLGQCRRSRSSTPVLSGRMCPKWPFTILGRASEDP
eukprot:TRINITY_DN1745_c0_g1_i16.p1 TRINITY_DN1745_c0_g1~~TRINITY_DN1745_c0_g1_i16.p1  ORF type:complete len:658 (-),score=119.46 TRINITY_DN1745_c0_g1_i16:936-2621(-)